MTILALPLLFVIRTSFQEGWLRFIVMLVSCESELGLLVCFIAMTKGERMKIIGLARNYVYGKYMHEKR